MFYKPSNKIIIVDDNEQDLITLSKEFHKNGIGCKTFQYDLYYNSPLRDIRIAFFDININPAGGSDSQRFNSLANAIKQYIHKDNGPFALIFWTKNKDDIEKLKAYIEEVHVDCPRPFLVNCLDKADFSLDSQEKLNNILSNKTLELLFDFENVSAKSASNTINEIFEIIPKNDKWGIDVSFNDNFEKIFSKLSKSTLGDKHAKKSPDKAVYEALIPILNYHITKNNRSEKWKSYLTSLAKTAPIKIPGFNAALLNSIFHIDTLSPVNLNQRGAVFEYYPTPFNAYRLSYFKEMQLQCYELFQKFIQINKELVGEEEQIKFANNSKFIVVETSAACDYSQNKPRNSKYILGLLTPFIEKEKINSNKISDSIFYKDLPEIYFKNERRLIWLNFNFTFSDFEINKGVGDALFIFKKEIMDMIGNRYANHVSRIGITTF